MSLPVWSQDLSGQVVMVTGGGSGIGAALCARLAGRGASVVVADLDADGAEAVAAETGSTALALDVAQRSAWDTAVAEVVDRHGRLDALALNAGVMTRPRGAPMDDDPLPWSVTGFERVRSVNIDGVVHGMFASLDALASDGGGRIVVTASVAGLMPQPEDPLYSMTKHAVIGLVQSMGPPLATRGVTVGALCPGGVDTPLVPPDIRATGRGFAPPDHVAGAIETVLGMPADETGRVWVSYGTEQPLWRYEMPSPREPPAPSATVKRA